MTVRILLLPTLMLQSSVFLQSNAATYPVTVFADNAATSDGSAIGAGDGPGVAGDLRYSILLANRGGLSNTITFVCAVSPCVITLNGPLPPIESNLTIDGGSLGTILIDGNNKYRVFFADTGGITLANLQIQNGLAVGGAGGDGYGPGGGGAGFGAGLFVNQPTAIVTVRNVRFLNCNVIGGNGGNLSGGGGGGGGGMAFPGGAGTNTGGGAVGVSDNGGGGGVLGPGQAAALGGNGGAGGGGGVVGGRAYASNSAGESSADGANGGFGGGGAGGGGNGGFGGGGGGGYGQHTFFSVGYGGGDGGFGGGGGGGDGGRGGGSGAPVGGIQGGAGGAGIVFPELTAGGGGGGAAAGPAIFVRLGSITITGSTGTVFSAIAGAAPSGSAGTANPAPVFNYGGTVNGSTATGPLLMALPSGTQATQFSVVPSTYLVTSGTAYSVTVTALDSLGHAVTGYNGIVRFTSTNTGARFANNLTSSPNLVLTNGTGTGGFVLTQAGAGFTITATDTSTASIFGVSSGIEVQPGPVNAISVIAPSSAVAGVPFEFSVTALDAYGNTIPTNSDAAVYSSSDPAASLPPSGALRSGTNFQATLNTPGIFETIKVTDATTGVSGTSGMITVSAPSPQFQVSSGLSSLSFSGSAGSASFSQAITITANGSNVSAHATAAASGGGNWLSVAGGGITPQTFTVTVNPAGLAAGLYKGSITITSNPPGANPLVIPVTLTLVAGPPAIMVSAYLNAGSLQSSSVAPNTILSAFGTFPSCTGAQVTVAGSPTIVFYSSATQINFLIPANVAGSANASVVVNCAGLSSTPTGLLVASAAPALFTVSQNGSGLADSINQDGSVDAAVARGTAVELYGTGFGLYAPISADGLTRMAQTVTATIGGQQAEVLFAGQAPGYTSGLQQIDLLVPADAPQGTSVPLVLTIGGVTTQSGLTLAVQ